jgi:hypothetical protein
MVAFAVFVDVWVMAVLIHGARAWGEFTPTPWHPAVFRQVMAVPPPKLVP